MPTAGERGKHLAHPRHLPTHGAAVGDSRSNFLVKTVGPPTCSLGVNPGVSPHLTLGG